MTTNLNTHADGPHAYSDRQQVEHWEATQWLLEYAADNNEVNGTSWSDWGDGENLRTTYTDDRNLEFGELPSEFVEVGERGMDILNAAIRGEDWRELMDDWNKDILAAAHGWDR